MATFRLEFDADNAAFDNDSNAEVSRVLRQVADWVANGRVDGPVRDSNGNKIGTFALALDTESSDD